MGNNSKPEIVVVSDSIGETAELVAQAAKIQFNEGIERIKKFSFILDFDQIDEVIDYCKGKKCLIVYTIVIKEMKDYINKKAKENNIKIVDVLGPLINPLTELTGLKPKREAGLNRQLTSYYFEKVEAIEFAVKYDDGKDPRGFKKADIVLVGISRTSKTPLSMYFAYKNYRVANLPLVPEVEPPKELFEVSKKKIVGLTNDPRKLNEIRRERLKDMGIKDNSNYADLSRIIEELDYADKIFNRLKCPVINVSNRAIEETASIIIHILSKNN
ncbi:MAG: kinase/pyrophosphorylase [Tissierellales bacterium]|jgi:regulator of PEP synthase PpsR (kinase-PPPase family)|nr:kinase/pyrophosphorylase [Tissierellales bacterium]HCX04898.1 phosphoenolpyruvate synthase regulatory protein [Clostridiales bacterium]